MMNFTVIDSPESAFYLKEPNYKDDDDRYFRQGQHFEDEDKITDINDNCNVIYEVGYSMATLYHPLPDGKIIEMALKQGYENNLENIYEEISSFRQFYDLSNQLPEKPVIGRKMKI